MERVCTVRQHKDHECMSASPPLQTLQDRLVAVEQSAQFDSEEGRRLRDSLWEELQRVHRALGKESTYGEQVREDLKVANSQIALLKVRGARGGTCSITCTEGDRGRALEGCSDVQHESATVFSL